MDAPVAAAPPPLPERLRQRTRALHAAAERSALMAALLAGRLPRARYVALLRSLHALYEALESALDARAADPAVALLDAPAQRRAAALAADLDVLHGPGWRTALPVAPAAAAYAARIGALAAAGRPALLAHAYVRYLGDLNGGQLLKQRVARGLGLSGDEGTRFYDFGDQASALRARFRDGLARLPLSAADEDALVAEACWGFGQHQRLFDELASV